jgi:Rap1a immunity proteins
MSNRSQSSMIALVFLCAQPVAPLSATDLLPLSSAELHKRCLVFSESPQSEEGRACAAYVRGFIEGSDRIVLRESDPIVQQQSESFSERALRTRLGRISPKPEYCLQSALSLQEFIAQMLAYAEDHPPASDASASVLLYGTLRRFYRCIESHDRR